MALFSQKEPNDSESNTKLIKILSDKIDVYSPHFISVLMGILLDGPKHRFIRKSSKCKVRNANHMTTETQRGEGRRSRAIFNILHETQQQAEKMSHS